MKLHTALFLAAAATLGLAGCSDSPAPETPVATPAASNEVPASATVSAAAYTEFAKSLTSSETGLPLDVNKVTPPTSETAAPLSL
jgi:uncharacterized lipoprotein YbaY